MVYPSAFFIRYILLLQCKTYSYTDNTKRDNDYGWYCLEILKHYLSFLNF